MRTRGRRPVIPILIAAAALFVIGSARAEQSFTDPVGDAGSSADISAVSIGNDQAGLLVFRITATAPPTPEQGFWIAIDADKNPATGFAGFEYLLTDSGVFGEVIGVGLSISFTPPPSFRSSVSGNTTEIAINRSDLGSTSGFGFQIDSLGEGDVADKVPDSGWLTYDLAFPQCSNTTDDDGDGKIDAQDLGCSSTTDEDESDDPVTLRAGKAKVTPVRPKAGGKAVVSVPVTRVETGQAIDSGVVTCAAKIVGGKTMRGTGKLSGGKAVCTFKVPPATKGKTTRGTVGVVYETASARAAFSFKVA